MNKDRQDGHDKSRKIKWKKKKHYPVNLVNPVKKKLDRIYCIDRLDSMLCLCKSVAIDLVGSIKI